MARSMKLAYVVLVMCMVVIAPMAEAAVSCETVTDDLAPCRTYLEGPNTATPSPECCDGVKKLLASTSTVADRRAACNCLNTAAASFSNLNANNAAALPRQCGVNIPSNISTPINCNSINF